MSSRNERPWAKVYLRRIAEGLERCRRCGREDTLTLARISRRLGPSAFGNTTILCEDHLNPHGAEDGRWRRTLPSLLAEEQSAPPEQRWGLASIEANACPICGQADVPLDRNGRLIEHKARGERCRGSLQRSEIAMRNRLAR